MKGDLEGWVEPPAPFRGNDCPPALRLEQWVAGERAQARLGEHLANCDGCRKHVAALEEAQAVFQRARPAELFVRQVRRRAETRPVPVWRRAWAIGLGLATLTLGVLLVVPRVPDSPVEPDLRLKGTPFRATYLRKGMPAPRPVADEQSLRPGDTLRFFYEAPRPGHIAVLDLDGAGQATVLYPYGGRTTAPLEASRREPLPGAIVLDDALGTELLVVIWSPNPVELAPLREALLESARSAQPTVSCQGCVVQRLRLQKEH